MTKTQTWTVFSIRIASILVKQGHELIETLPDLKRPGKEVFLFKVDETFHRDLQDATKGGSRNGSR